MTPMVNGIPGAICLAAESGATNNNTKDVDTSQL